VGAHPIEENDDLHDVQIRVVHLGELGARNTVDPGKELIELLAPETAAPETPAPERRPPRTDAPNGHGVHAPAGNPRPPVAATAGPGAAERAPPAPAPVIARSPSSPPPSVAPRTDTAAAAAATGTVPVLRPRRLITPGRVFFLAVVALLYIGWNVPTERYITPKRGLGYALGIIGGSLMLILLLYSLRKRYNWMRFLGATPSWFRFHMVLGILGPLCILYHANFSTGATNSNVALFCMLTVAGSGVIGRYIYARIHHGLYGRKLELHELRGGAEKLRESSAGVRFLPELVGRLDAADQRVLTAGPRLPLFGFAKPPIVALAAMLMRWRLHGYVRRALRAAARKSPAVASERRRLYVTACTYVDRRLAASRRVAGFEGYERLFSLWHALHIPLIFMMIIAAVIHIIAVHVY
jgi:hypothetical protein